jgi:SNF2 family DNA or RNA helicase
VLIGYEFHHDLERLRRALPKGTPCLTGVSMKEYDALERDWNRGNIPIALAQISSISHGNNLQGSGAALIVHSFIWNYEDYDQFIKRVKRQGNKAKRAYVYRIVAERTVDEAMMSSWDAKATTQNDLFQALKRSLHV